MRSMLVCALVALLAGCGGNFIPDEQVGADFGSDCVENYDYAITKDNLDQPVSPHKVYFYLDSEGVEARKKIRLVVKQDTPIVTEVGLTSDHQIVPVFYQWHLVFAQDRNWYTDFFQADDGFYYTTLELTVAEWQASSLCVFFKDINSDGVDDNLMFRILIGDIVSLPPTPEEKINEFLQAILKEDSEAAIASWYIFDAGSDEKQTHRLLSRREETITNLLNLSLLSEYQVVSQESWTGGESTQRIRIESAWLARNTVRLVTITGEKQVYIFDLVNRNYNTVPDAFLQDWVIVDIYSKGEQAYFWEPGPQP